MSVVACGKCGSALGSEFFGVAEPMPCPVCLTPVLARVFPALYRPPERSEVGERTVVEEEATCFFHPESRAQVPCDSCGRFLCSLCDCEIAGDHLCPSCLESGKRGGKLGKIEDKRVLHDSLCLLLALVPMLMFYLTFVTAPIVIFLAVRHWNAPSSLLRRTKTRFVIAVLVALLQLVGWTIGLISLFV